MGTWAVTSATSRLSAATRTLPWTANCACSTLTSAIRQWNGAVIVVRRRSRRAVSNRAPSWSRVASSTARSAGSRLIELRRFWTACSPTSTVRSSWSTAAWETVPWRTSRCLRSSSLRARPMLRSSMASERFVFDARTSSTASWASVERTFASICATASR